MLQNETPYVYVITRKDLPASYQAVQSCHAGIEGAKAFHPPKDHYLVICTVKNEAQLHKAMSQLDLAKIKYIQFNEPDINNELTAICSEVVCGSQREAFKKYQLLRI